MPELPEVETVRRDLEPFLAGRVVRAVAITRDRAVRRQPHADFAAGLVGRTLRAVRRHGKYLFVELDGDEALVAHLRMSGQLRAAPPDEARAKHTHVVVDLDDGAQLRFVDPRTFGELFLDRIGPDGRPLALAALGPDAIDPKLDAARLHAQLTQGRRVSSVKAALLDQRAVAGVGNIYADEALFAAGIAPLRPAAKLTLSDATRLRRELRRILHAAIRARGSSLSDYVDAYGGRGSFVQQHRVYGREGQPCTVCGGLLERTVVAQRGTTHCRTCQR